MTSTTRSPREGSGGGATSSWWRSGGRRAALVTWEATLWHRASPRPTHKGRQSMVRAGDSDASGKIEEEGGAASPEVKAVVHVDKRIKGEVV
jgi:hypothetical protein